MSTIEPSVRDRAARLIAIASNELWGHDGPPDPSDIEEGEHVADALAAAGLLAGGLTINTDPKPQPGDGPEYHADLAAWLERH